jgi:UTP--glucose-1-phosphate uridylyltransferase
MARSKNKVTKAVIAAAGFGTRFLPQTKAMPKEMLPLVDKPIIQHVVEELVEAGIKDIIIVSNYSKRSIEDHFDTPNRDLVANLEQGGKTALLAEVERIADLANFVYVRQKGPYGNATPLQCAQHLIGDEPFIYTYADDLIDAQPNRFMQMVSLYEEFKGAILPCIRVTTDKEFARYGIVGGEVLRDGVVKMNAIVEKPGRDNAPSDLASIGGYLLTPDIFAYLERLGGPAEGKEFMIQPAMQLMMEDGLPMYACALREAHYHDTGDKLEYLKTIVDFALRHDDISAEFREFLRSKVQG